MRRIRNITSDPLEVPLLGVTIEPGDVANVPEDLDYLDFSPAFFEVDEHKAKATRKGHRNTDDEDGN